ncbi:isoprenylcysteine carboxylmethyltransferase family protein [Flavobacteriaceae bacterium F89]|uniref:Isoprenylcysteine carboxylmethyltransferase family protein n=1 Tax=Cerina litoralis TaxID=2874477 RepID=A0AAE3JP17_9FLAO|nr:isoprenylcysteine carboxylmethyltransferase family protein [Cerina litoralis]MCG2460501.1 isoprenylcysteine carboxylmethyltransferase family protein [Cerina litoralis]
MIILKIVWVLWLLSEILLNRLLRSTTGDKKKKDKGSLWMIWITIILSINIGIFLSYYIDLPLGTQPTLIISGTILIVLGMLLRFYSISSLGKFFTVDVTIREDHTLKTDGIYGWVRHPSYLGSLIFFAGFGISINNWISFLTIIIPVTLVFLYRIKIEEKVLIEQFGQDYKVYMDNSYHLIPWIY